MLKQYTLIISCFRQEDGGLPLLGWLSRILIRWTHTPEMSFTPWFYPSWWQSWQKYYAPDLGSVHAFLGRLFLCAGSLSLKLCIEAAVMPFQAWLTFWGVVYFKIFGCYPYDPLGHPILVIVSFTPLFYLLFFSFYTLVFM